MTLPVLLAQFAFQGISQVLQASNENAAARKINKAEQEDAKRQQARADAQYNLDRNQQVSQYLWDVARTAQMRKVEAENEMDTVNTGTRIINAAANSLRLNSEALYDKFITEESLRAKEVGINYASTQDKLSADTMSQVSQFLNGVNSRVAESAVMEAQGNRSRSELLQQLNLEARRDQMEWQMAQVAGLAKAGEEGARLAEAQGGGVTAQRVALDALAALGRQYEKLTLGVQDRDVRLGMTRMMDDEMAKRMALQAIEVQDYVQRSQYALNRYGADSRLAQSQLEDLTIPTFGLGQRQYRRELEGLQLQAREQFDSASTPYRRQEFFDPLSPIAGLPPTVQKPRKASEVGTGSVMAGLGVTLGKSFLSNAIDKEGGFKSDLGLSMT